MKGSLTGILETLKGEISKVIVGQEYLIERLFVALITKGHVLLEGVPGLAKTKTLTALTKCINASMKRIQFTPDLLPSDLIGTEVYNQHTGDFSIRKGPVFTNLLLADEINRSPAKVQSALLQAMQEREVTIGEETFRLPDPFLVLATQNPIEQEGTYPLPEAQVDRFIMKLKVEYPSYEEEVEILSLVASSCTESASPEELNEVIGISDLQRIREEADKLYIDPKIDHYIVSLVQASRKPESVGLDNLIDWGASPRAGIAMKQCARALAYLRGKEFVTPDDVKEIAHDVLRHRILPSFEAEARGVDSDNIVSVLLKNVTVP
ncbi:MAG: MoxR family ATPase [Candidatus Dadabacteria bacterium]|nr:MAG: MoxR family ATPase [Candidatus Dadabacteria bacterium]